MFGRRKRPTHAQRRAALKRYDEQRKTKKKNNRTTKKTATSVSSAKTTKPPRRATMGEKARAGSRTVQTAAAKEATKRKDPSRSRRRSDAAINDAASGKLTKKPTRFGQGSSKTITRNGRKLANVSADQLKKTGMSLKAYIEAWNKTGKRPTKRK